MVSMRFTLVETGVEVRFIPLGIPLTILSITPVLLARLVKFLAPNMAVMKSLFNPLMAKLLWI